ncbi:hypothetical protein CDV31_001960 [Fusarium ambrosium]|uniref:Uncharacterized protein n=1 Tax=Fusarium ambrosium TaxID=131363 RepID=A0A428UYE2_9HYPO|nr:hypothetical protein CDV31_001960 [Fusarium ambrosium]
MKGTRRSLKRKDPPSFEPEDEAPKNEDDKLSNLDTIVDLGFEGSEEAVQTVSSTIDDTSWIRVGPQPVKAHCPDVRSAPTKFAHFKVLRTGKHVLKLMDRHLPGVIGDELTGSADRITQRWEICLECARTMAYGENEIGGIADGCRHYYGSRRCAGCVNKGYDCTEIKNEEMA